MTDPAQSVPEKRDRATHQAILWWQQRQIRKRETWAEMLRENAFQDLFALRRSLALSLDDRDIPSLLAHQGWLQRLERLSVDLYELRKSLHPAFVEDSLPLALRQKVESWKQRLPRVQFKLTALTIGLPNSTCDNWLILDILEEWLQVLEEYLVHGGAIAFSLETNSPEQILRMTLSGMSPAHPVSIQDPSFQRLTTLFALLLEGQCQMQIQHEQIMWCFRWQPRLNQTFDDL